METPTPASFAQRLALPVKLDEGFYDTYYGQLVGRRIVRVVHDGNDTYGFELDNGKTCWMLQDPEGNGPGHLDIVNSSSETACQCRSNEHYVRGGKRLCSKCDKPL